MISGFKQARDKIEEIYPEFKESNFYPISEGLDNYVILVDNKYIFRFPRTENSNEQLRIEDTVLNDIASFLPSNIKVPKFIFKGNKEDVYVGYDYIVGNYLTNELFNTLSLEQKDNVAKSLGKFLTIMHTMDYNKYNVLKYTNKDIYSSLWDNVVNKCFTFLNDDEQEKVNNLFNKYENDSKYNGFTPCLIHGDLKVNQIIYSENNIGIIDFGAVKVYDPAYDFADIYNAYGEEFLKMVYSYYEGPKDDMFIFRVIDMHSEKLPFNNVLNSLLMHNEELLLKTIIELKTFINKL